MAEKYTLNWHAFSEHLQVMVKDLYQEGRYTDVTLVSDDQTQFKAHKIVLSACSPVFRKIIDSNPSQHPLIYLRGIQSYELASILQFIYLGEAKCFRERMGEFLQVAKDLEVKDISEGVEMENEPEETVDVEINTDDTIEQTVMEENEINEEAKIGKARRNFSDTKSTECPECHAVFTLRNVMLRHYRSKHQGILYHCDQCDYKAKRQYNIRSHIANKHSDLNLQ